MDGDSQGAAKQGHVRGEHHLQLSTGCGVLQLGAHHRHPVCRASIHLCLHQHTLLWHIHHHFSGPLCRFLFIQAALCKGKHRAMHAIPTPSPTLCMIRDFSSLQSQTAILHPVTAIPSLCPSVSRSKTVAGPRSRHCICSPPLWPAAVACGKARPCQ